jgi:hypothetical protein
MKTCPTCNATHARPLFEVCRECSPSPSSNPICPRCNNNRQVWVNQITKVMTCHRVGCELEITNAERSHT